MTEIGTNERLLSSNVTPEECKKIEKVLRRNNISYCERWKPRSGLFKIFDVGRADKCDIYIHMDSFEEAKRVLAEPS